jgi:hypothetical protein
LSNRRDHRRDRVVAALGIVIASAGLFSLMLASSGRSFGALPIAIVQLLAVAEIVCAAGLFFSRTRRPAGLSLIALLLILWGDEHVTWRSEDTTAARTSPASGSLAAHQPSSWQITNSGMWNDLVDVPHLELASADNGQVRIEIPRTTAERLPWQIQAVQAGHDLRRGAVYRLRFRARGDANRLLDYSVEGMDAPHLSSTDVEVQLTPEWQKYSVVLEALSDGGSQVAFKVGQSAVSLDLADVKLEEMKDVRPGEIVSWVLDVHSAEARAHAPRLELPDGPPWRIRVHLDESMHPGVSWAVQLNHHGVSVQHGHRYTLQFQARADAARPFSYMVGRGRAPFDDLGLYINDVLATDWRPYKSSFFAKDDESIARIAFDLGAASPSVEVRNVVLLDDRTVTVKAMAAAVFNGFYWILRNGVPPLSILGLMWALSPWAELAALIEFASWLAGFCVGVILTRQWTSASAMRTWFFPVIVVAWVCGLLTMVAARLLLARWRPADHSSPALTRRAHLSTNTWGVNAGYWIALSGLTALLSLLGNIRGAHLGSVEAGYIFVDRFFLFTAVLLLVHTAARLARLQESKATYFLYSVVASIIPLMAVLDFAVTDKTGTPLLGWIDKMTQVNGLANLSQLLEWSGYTPSQLEIVFLFIAASFVAMRLLGAWDPVGRIDEIFARRRGLVLVGYGFVAVSLIEAAQPGLLGAAALRRFASVSELRLFAFDNDPPGQVIPVVFRRPPQTPYAELNRVAAAPAAPDIFFIVIDSLRADAVNPRVAPALSAFRSAAWSAERTYSASYGSELSWYSILHSRHAFRWKQEPDDGRGAYPLRLLRRLGYRVEVRLGGDSTWMGMGSRLYGTNRDLADTFFDSNTEEMLAHRPYEERDRLLTGDLIRALGQPPRGSHVYIQELLSTHWEYHWPADHTGPFPDFAPTVDFTRLNYSTEDVQLVRHRYLNAVSWADHLFGRIVEALKDKGRYDDSLIIVTGDHGEDLYEEGRWAHGSYLCRHQTEVPLLIKWPRGTQPPAARRLMGHVDIMPSILDLLHVDPVLRAPLDGVSAFRPRTSLVLSSDQVGATDAGLVFVNPNLRTELSYWSSRTGAAPDRLRIFKESDQPDETPDSLRRPGETDIDYLKESFPQGVEQLFSSFGSQPPQPRSTDSRANPIATKSSVSGNSHE